MDSDHLECKICCLEFSVDDENLTPRMLTCGHTICQECAGRLLKDRTIHCPFDRTRTSYVDDVKKLAKNFLLIEILEEKKKKEAKTETSPREKCVENEDHDAEWYCDNCEAVFCESCFTTAHASKVHALHTKLPLSEKPYKLPKCEKHPKNTAEFVCNVSSCSPKPFCHTCLVTAHKDHSIEELAVRVDKENDKLIRLLNTNTLTRNQLCEEVEDLESVEKKYSKDSAEYMKLKKDIKSFYDRKMRTALKDFERVVDQKYATVHKIKVEQEKKLAEVKSLNLRILDIIGPTASFDFEETEKLQREVERAERNSRKRDGAFKDEYPNLERFCK